MIGTGAINNNPTFNWIKSLERGTIFAYSTNGPAPDGALICNGAEISRTTYKLLFDVIGTTYGAGNGTTTFNLPDLSNARIVTNATVSVVGTGKTIGFTNGNGTFYGLRFMAVDGNSGCYASTNAYGATTPQTSTGGDRPANGEFLGLTTDPVNSGITGSVNLATPTRYYIKY